MLRGFFEADFCNDKSVGLFPDEHPVCPHLHGGNRPIHGGNGSLTPGIPLVTAHPPRIAQHATGPAQASF